MGLAGKCVQENSGAATPSGLCSLEVLRLRTVPSLNAIARRQTSQGHRGGTALSLLKKNTVPAAHFREQKSSTPIPLVFLLVCAFRGWFAAMRPSPFNVRRQAGLLPGSFFRLSRAWNEIGDSVRRENADAHSIRKKPVPSARFRHQSTDPLYVFVARGAFLLFGRNRENWGTVRTPDPLGLGIWTKFRIIKCGPRTALEHTRSKWNLPARPRRSRNQVLTTGQSFDPAATVGGLLAQTRGHCPAADQPMAGQRHHAFFEAAAQPGGFLQCVAHGP